MSAIRETWKPFLQNLFVTDVCLPLAWSGFGSIDEKYQARGGEHDAGETDVVSHRRAQHFGAGLVFLID